MKNIIIKIFTLPICLISFLISNEVKHNYESAIMPYTKTPNAGRINASFNFFENSKSNAFIGTEEVDIGSAKLNAKEYVISAIYHGYNGAGYDFSFSSNKYSVRDDIVTLPFYSIRERNITAGVYFIWNEIFPNSSPGVVSGKQFTFPTTRVLVGLYAKSIDSDLSKTTSAILKVAMDFIISNKCILTNQVSFNLGDKQNINTGKEEFELVNDALPLISKSSSDFINSKLIMDVNDMFTYGIGLEYRSNRLIISDQTDFEISLSQNLTSITFDAGIQFKNLNKGYMNYTFKLNPYARYVLSGKNIAFTQNEIGIKLNVLFN